MVSQAVHPKQFPWFDYSNYSFSLGIAAGNGVYLSGHTASTHDPGTARIVIRGGMADQARTAYDKVGAILDGAGLSYGNVVRVVEYVRPEGIEHYAEAAAVREEVFSDHQPTVNTVPVKALLRPDALIEIEITASARPTGAAPASGGTVFLPTVQAVDDNGDIIGAGDVVAQTEAIFASARKTLAALGLGFDRVVKTLDYFTPAAMADYRRTGGVRKDFLGPVYPCAAGIFMPRLLHPDALIQYDFIATQDKPMAVNPGWQRYEKLSYSPGVRAGKLLFLSGQGAVNPETHEVEHAGDVVAQAEYTYGNIFKVIEAAGGAPENLVKTIEYITPDALKHYREVGGLRSKVLAKPYAAATGLICEKLLRPEMLIEVDPFAVLD